MIRLRGQMICMTPEEVLSIRQHLPRHSALTRAEPGCRMFEVSETDDPMIYEVMEAFADRASFDAHQARTRDSDWFAATRSILRDFRLEEVGD